MGFFDFMDPLGIDLVGGQFKKQFNQAFDPENPEAMDPVLADILAGKGGADYQALTDKDGNLLDRFKLKGEADVNVGSNLNDLIARLNGINLNKDGLEAIRKRALSPGQSQWADLMMQKQGIEEGAAMDAASRSGTAATNKAFSDLAVRGGLSKGARERIATKGNNALAMAKADARRQGMLDRFGIGTTDEAQKLDLLKGLPGMEVQALQPEMNKTSMWADLADSETNRKMNLDLSNRNYRTDINKNNLDSLIKDVGGRNTYEQGKYAERMKAWAANKQAQATAAAGDDGKK